MSQRKLYVPPGFSGVSHWDEAKSLHQALDMARTRLLVVCSSFMLVFLFIAGRLIDLGVLKRHSAETFCQESCLQNTRFRADIVDRNGEILATSLKTPSLYANARVILDAKEAALKLTQALPELSYKETLHRLQSGKAFVWLARHLTPQKQAEIIRLGLPGIYFQQDERRVYPHGELFSHVLGYTDVDNKGLGGIERKFDKFLVSAKEKESLPLSLDIRVQHVLRDELLVGIEKFNAQGGAGMIMNVRTGEILAMVSLPDFDPNQVGKIGPQKDVLFNRITLGAYEMGSSFKIFSTAMYLERGAESVHTKFDVTVPLRVGRFRITDIHPARYPLTVAEIFTESSNIGVAKMAMQMGGAHQKDFFKKLGFFQSSSLEIPEIGAPLYPKDWSEATTITASYGYGISISPLQLATAIGGILNKGVMQQPTLLKASSGEISKGKRVVSEETSEIMRKLMYMVVTQGTGRKAQVKGYEVGGKTGTANTLEGGSYKKGTNMTSFVGAFPMSNPQYIVLIMVDRPKPTKETYGFTSGGWNAAPVAAKVIERIAPLLHVVPVRDVGFDSQKDSLLIHASSPQSGGR